MLPSWPHCHLRLYDTCQKATGKFWWLLGEANVLYIDLRKPNIIASNLEKIMFGQVLLLEVQLVAAVSISLIVILFENA